MNFQLGSFSDYDDFKEAIKDWTLDFTILSKADFSASFNMFTSDSFLLSRERLNAKIEHSGLSPIGFRTIVIPANYDVEFVWFNKKVSGKTLMVFPKSNLIDVVTYPGLDIHLLSIKETLLFEIMDMMGFKNCQSFFNGNIKEAFLTREFSLQFFQLADAFLNSTISSTEIRQKQIHHIIYFLLTYLEESQQEEHLASQKKKDVALKKAIEIIHDEKDTMFSMPQLCAWVGVSERTLFDAFKGKYQLAPTDYIKSFRLNKVKQEIQLAEGVSISEIAGKYHFWHMGQFAKDFKKQFGILPSEVKRKLS